MPGAPFPTSAPYSATEPSAHDLVNVGRSAFDVFPNRPRISTVPASLVRKMSQPLSSGVFSSLGFAPGSAGPPSMGKSSAQSARLRARSQAAT